MEDITEDYDPVINIDRVDLENPLAVVDYVGDLYEHYRKTEVNCLISWLPLLRGDDLISSSCC